jgi:hypothetical protein
MLHTLLILISGMWYFGQLPFPAIARRILGFNRTSFRRMDLALARRT